MKPLPTGPLVALPPQPAGLAWPTDTWPEAKPGDVGGDAGRLDDLLDELIGHGEHPSVGRTYAVGVVARGQLVAERYGERVVQDLRSLGDDPPYDRVEATTELLSWSMAKSITSLAVGAAVADGRLDLDDPVADPQWTGDPNDPRAAITWAHLLSMRPGLQWTEEYYDLRPDDFPDVVAMLYGDGAQDMGRFAAAFPLVHPPGSTEAYLYSSGTTNIVAANLQRVLGLDQAGMDAFLRERIFDPIGMASARAQYDAAGTFVGSSFVHATLRDWCRFGLLALRGGVWDGRPLVADGWIDWCRQPRSRDETVIHGAHWWSWDLDEQPFGAHGFEGQRVIAFPARDVVVVRLGKMGPNDAPALNDFLASVAACFPLL